MPPSKHENATPRPLFCLVAGEVCAGTQRPSAVWVAAAPLVGVAAGCLVQRRQRLGNPPVGGLKGTRPAMVVPVHQLTAALAAQQHLQAAGLTIALPSASVLPALLLRRIEAGCGVPASCQQPCTSAELLALHKCRFRGQAVCSTVCCQLCWFLCVPIPIASPSFRCRTTLGVARQYCFPTAPVSSLLPAFRAKANNVTRGLAKSAGRSAATTAQSVGPQLAGPT